MSLDVKNLLIQDWMTTTATVHDSTVTKAQIDSGQGYKYFLGKAESDSLAGHSIEVNICREV